MLASNHGRGKSKVNMWLYLHGTKMANTFVKYIANSPFSEVPCLNVAVPDAIGHQRTAREWNCNRASIEAKDPSSPSPRREFP